MYYLGMELQFARRLVGSRWQWLADGVPRSREFSRKVLRSRILEKSAEK